MNQEKIHKIKHGLVLTCIGDEGNFNYKKSRKGNTKLDQVVANVLKETENDFNVLEFYPWGSDERQFCSPGFNLSFGTLMRGIPNRTITKEYHTSNDNLEFMNRESLQKSFEKCFLIISELDKEFHKTEKVIDSTKEENFTNDKSQEYYINLNPKCEPQLGKRGLYRQLGSQKNSEKSELAMFWILNQSDGKNSLLDIAIKSLDLKKGDEIIVPTFTIISTLNQIVSQPYF